MEFHPLANLFPMMTDKELSVLADDIKANGQQIPIYLCDGKILDGRNRFKACEIAGVDPKIEQFTGTDPLSFVVSMNLKRRHLNESQRSMIAARIENMKHGGDRKKDQDANLHLDRTHAAEMLNVSPRSVAAAKSVQEKGTAKLIEAVDAGTIAVSDAAAIVDLPKEDQRRALENVRSGKTKNLRKVKRQMTKRKQNKYPGILSKGLFKNGELLPITHPDSNFENEYKDYQVVTVRIVRESDFQRFAETR